MCKSKCQHWTPPDPLPYQDGCLRLALGGKGGISAVAGQPELSSESSSLCFAIWPVFSTSYSIMMETIRLRQFRHLRYPVRYSDNAEVTRELRDRVRDASLRGSVPRENNTWAARGKVALWAASCVTTATPTPNNIIASLPNTWSWMLSGRSRFRNPVAMCECEAVIDFMPYFPKLVIRQQPDRNECLGHNRWRMSETSGVSIHHMINSSVC